MVQNLISESRHRQVDHPGRRRAYTGRTTRSSLDALFREGRPLRVQLCVLIDRGHRELPIEAAFIGRTVQGAENEIIQVKLQEVDSAEKVLLMEKVAAEPA